MKSISNDYTGVFRNVTSISTKPLESLCTSRISDIRQEMPGGFDQLHCLHPVTLDLCFQAVMPALMAAEVLDSSILITFVEELSISGDIESVCGTEFLTHTVATKYGTSKYKVNMDVQETSKPSSALSITAKALTCTILSRDSATGRDVSEKDQKLCHHVEWVPDISCATPEDARQLCNARLGVSSSLGRLHGVNFQARSIIMKTIASIEPQDEKRMLPHHKVQLNWMRKNANSGDLTQDTGPVQNLGVEGEMLERIDAGILDILKGNVHPLAVLTEGDLLYRYYNNESLARCNAQVAEFAHLLSRKNPSMKVLEIGAGTGSATVPFLQAVSSRSGQLDYPLLDRYVFTDISTGFFEQAKRLLEPWENAIEYRKLNIEQSIHEQGFEAGSYDLLVACNVLHATSVMSDTIRNARKLLKPGGKLCLTEVTRPMPFHGLIFGTLPGWWLGAEEGRVDSPLLSVDQWGTLLTANGFSGIDLWLPDYDIDQEHQYSAIISTAVEDIRQPLISALEIILPDVNGHGPEHSGAQERSYAQRIVDHYITTTKHVNVSKTSISDIEPEDKYLLVMLETERPFLSSCLEAEFEQLKRMFSLAKGIIWVTKGGAVECIEPLNATITGLARSIRSENRLAKLITLDIDSSHETSRSIAQILSRIIEKSFGAPSEAVKEHEYAARNGLIMIPRLTEDGDLNQYLSSSRSRETPQIEPFFQDGRPLALQIGTPGLLGSLAWADATCDQALAPDEVRIEIRCGGVNFRDLMVALGQLEGYSKIGDEYSGVILEVGPVASRSFQVGDRVCGVGGGTYASSSVVKTCNIQRIPDSLPFETAASIPVAYTTAYYCLVTAANLQRGESVLIHSAAGGLGQAAVMIAKSLGATIYITVGNSKKKSFMMTNFDIPEEHIFSSRLTTFSSGIKRLTGGKGVDVLLNSLAADTLRESCACLAAFGRFIEVGRRDASVNARLSMEMFMRHVMFASVDLSLIYKEKPMLCQQLLGTVIDLIHTGAVGKIRPIQVVPFGQLEDAYHQMQQGKHIGKIVLKADSATKVKVLPLPRTPAKFREDSWYVVAGGTGGLGQAIISWMADLGSKNIIAISRSGTTGEKSLKLFKEMAAIGVNLVIKSCDVTDTGQVHKLLEVAAGKPIAGIIQGAMMLNDALVNDMSFKQWQDTTSIKIQGTQNLYNVLGGSLDFFVMLSSVVGTLGTYGQGNYAAGSSFQDAFARHMSSAGFPVRSLDLGAIAEAGYVAEHAESMQYLARQGMKMVPLEKFMTFLNYAIDQPLSRDLCRSQLTLGLPVDDSLESCQRSDSRFSHLSTYDPYRQDSTAGKETVNIATALSATETRQEAVGLVCESIIEKVASLLATPAADLSPSRSILDYGVDSLIAVELRNWIAMHLQADVQMLELLGAASIQRLAATIASRCRLVPAFSTAERG